MERGTQMPKPQCLARQEFEELRLRADRLLSDAHRMLKDSDPDDSANNRRNFDACLDEFRLRVRDLTAHEDDCEECNSEN